MTIQKPLFDMHAEHNEWLSKLEFYKEELAIMRNRIDEIANKNNSKEVLSVIDHFQNQLIIQKTQISNLKHEIKNHEAAIEASIVNNPVGSDHRKSPDHGKHKGQLERFEEIFSELRKEFNGFLSKTM